MDKNITSANAIYMLGVAGLFTAPFQLQKFSADNIFTTDTIQSAEAVMGVDGWFTAGFVYVPIPQSIELMADSESAAVFDQWWQANKKGTTVFWAQATIQLPSIQTQYTMSRGTLTGYAPISDASKTLRARRFGITWGDMSASPLAPL